ncbi:proclotting enzyme-like [Eriocheir sinensis]|uniref:proclotting enzyme-like n=1 Tax=Eriocheir sinensis TaxID=95602 RepID=UPI0021C7B461|nr:proclotting enzyme-like [Eriocheir sinensis]
MMYRLRLLLVMVVVVVAGVSEGVLLYPFPRLNVDPLNASGGSVSSVKIRLPRLGSTVNGAVDRGKRLAVQEGGVAVSSLIPVQECNKTFALDDGEAALLYARHDLYRYSCRQVFKAVNLGSQLVFACHQLQLKFNCFIESLRVKVDGAEEVYCSNDAAPTRKGEEIEVHYERRMGGITGGFVCTVAAELTLPPRLKEDPACTSCGVTESMDKGRDGGARSVLRVVGGQDATQEDYPWMAYLIMQAHKERFSCGGTLVTDTIILTAAHCFHGYGVEKVEVGLGKHGVSVLDEARAQWFMTTNFIVHPEYDANNIQNDAALVILSNPITFTPYVRPACLPHDDPNLDGVTVTATGWGTLKYGGDLATVLQKVELRVWSNRECQTAWRGAFNDPSFTLLASQLCASNPGKDTCSGDSGGPLQIKVDGRWVVVGITSYGYKCAVDGVPGIYTRVTKFLPWLNSYIPDNYCSDDKA